MGNGMFNMEPISKVGSNNFNLSHDLKTSFKMGQLVPTCAMEVLPGDKFNIGVQNMLRFAPMIAPVMHTVDVTTHYFFVPNRILWDGWEDFITGESDAEPPYLLALNPNKGSLADYMGVPVGYSDTLKLNALPFAAYLKIFDEYYRDQNLQSELFDGLQAGNNNNVIGPDGTPLVVKYISPPRKRAWEHDYFTSSLPFAQKGDAVTLPLVNEQSVRVEYDPTALSSAGIVIDAGTNLPAQTDALGVPEGLNFGDVSSNLAQGSLTYQDALGNWKDLKYDPNGSLIVDINAEAATITDLRRAFRLQEFLEKDARGGTRYIENTMVHFGVKGSDHRLNRPEYIGGGKQKMVISEVLSTAQTIDGESNDIPIGQMAGHGISVGGSKNFNYYAEEHGWIIGITNVQPRTAYQQGIHRSLTRETRLDYPFPEFAKIGEQAVLYKEIYMDTNEEGRESVWGYMPRYSEMRYMNNRVSGEMRDTLSYWHLGRIFANGPALNQEFIECKPDKRIFAVTDPDEDELYAHIFFNINVRRKLPLFGVPTI